MRTQLNEWFFWNDEANRMLIQTIAEKKSVMPACAEMLSHLMKVHDIWLCRICGVNPEATSAKDADEFIDLNTRLHFITQQFLSSESYGRDFEWSFSYRSEGGECKQITLKEVYFHILTYSTFQRGQLVKMLFEKGIEPPPTDYLSRVENLNR